MEYTNKDFVRDLLMRKPFDYFKSKPNPTDSYLWQVVRDTKNIDMVKYYMDKLPHDKAVHTAVVNGKLDIADMLISNGVMYNSAEFQFRKPESIRWAKQHGIDITLDRVSSYLYDIDMITALLSCYPHLCGDIKLHKCQSLVLGYILTNYDVVITDKLVRHILFNRDMNCYLLIAHKIDPRKHIKEIASSSYQIVEYVLRHSDLTIADFGMYLFSGYDVKNKLEAYASQIPDFVTKAKDCSLMLSYVGNNNTSAALYLLQHYNICLNELDEVNTARAIVIDDIDSLLSDEFISDKDTISKYRVAVSQSNTVGEILQLYEELYK